MTMLADTAPGATANTLTATADAPVVKIRFRQGNHSPFYRILKERVRAHLVDSGRTRFADRRILYRGVACLTTALGAYTLILTGGFGPFTLLALANVYGLASLLLALNVAHDAAHGALLRSSRGNWIVLFGCFCLLGADPYLWRLRHVRSHHVFPNVNGCDIDIDNNAFLRLTPNRPRRWYHRYQHLYAPFIFWLVDIHTVFIQDVAYLFKRRLANLIDIRHPLWVYVAFIACKAMYVSIVFIVPVLVLSLPWWQVLIGALTMSFASSCLFVYLLIGTHFAEETVFPEPDADGAIGHDWAVHAMQTSLDWSPYSRLGQFLTGGANAHAAHHLFPNICHIHYPEVTRIIAATAREFGIRHNVTTLPCMVRSHFRFLKALGRAPYRPPSNDLVIARKGRHVPMVEPA